MLTEQRYELILRLLEDKKSITVAEVRDLLRTSESTVRRDITALDKAGKLTKVFGIQIYKITRFDQRRCVLGNPSFLFQIHILLLSHCRLCRNNNGDDVRLSAG